MSDKTGAHNGSRDEKPSAAWTRYQRYRRGVRMGQAIMLVAAVVASVHLLLHLGIFGMPPTGWDDLLVGYPTAGGFLLGGAILAGRRAPR